MTSTPAQTPRAAAPVRQRGPRVFLKCSPRVFVWAIGNAREVAGNARAAHLAQNVTDRPAEDYTDAVTRISTDWCSGYAVMPDGELVSVFSSVSGRGNDIVRAAVADGATHLDCFEGHLSTLYARHGFEIVRREPNHSPGGPDVVWMRRPTA